MNGNLSDPNISMLVGSEPVEVFGSYPDPTFFEEKKTVNFKQIYNGRIGHVQNWLGSDSM